MNFKERGITVGDLLITLILVISTIFIISKVSENKKEVLSSMSTYVISNIKND